MKFKLFHAPDGAPGGSPAETPVIAPPPVMHSADPNAPVKIAARDVSVFYGDKQALFDVSMDVADKTVTALIGAVQDGGRGDHRLLGGGPARSAVGRAKQLELHTTTTGVRSGDAGRLRRRS